MSATLIERITGRRRAAEQKSVESYHELVVAVADEQDVDPARADAVLLNSAHSPTDLDRDVAALRQRRADAEIAARLPGLRDQREKLSNTLVSSREALRLAETEWREQTTQTNLAINELSWEIQQCEQAERRLRASRPDPRRAELLAQRNQLSTRRGALAQEIESQRRHLGELKKALKAGPQPHASEFPGPYAPSIIANLAYDENMLRDGITAFEGNIRGIETELAQLDARLAEVNAELDAIERRQLSAE